MFPIEQKKNKHFILGVCNYLNRSSHNKAYIFSIIVSREIFVNYFTFNKSTKMDLIPDDGDQVNYDSKIPWNQINISEILFCRTNFWNGDFWQNIVFDR